MVPTHHGCNNRKSTELFTDETLLFYLGLWKGKQKKIQEQLKAFSKTANRDKQFISIAKIIEAGDISKEEVIQYVLQMPRKMKYHISEPLVITFGINVSEMLDDKRGPASMPRSYEKACDWLENDLRYQLLKVLPVLSQQTEASGRNGETISIRIAFWNFDIDRLDEFEVPPWEILEVAQYSEVYNETADDLLAKSLVSAYYSVINDPFDINFGVRKCPKCGSNRLQHSSFTDYKHDDTYYSIKCEECGWSDWTQ